MQSLYLFLISESILFPLIVGLVRLRRSGKGYRPFFLMIACAALNEPISFLFIRMTHSNAIPNNIYALIEWLLIAWQFHKWGLLQTRKKVFYVLVLFVSLIWVTEDLVLREITIYPPYFTVFYCFLIVLFSVNKINFMITHDDRNLLRHPEFLICIGFIIYFIYKIVYEWAYQSSLYGATDITTTIISLFGYINALTNIIFSIALLRIPAPEKFTLR